MALGPGLTVLVLVPELYLPIRRLGAEFHASAAGLAVAERMLALLDAPAASVDRAGAAPPSPAVAAVRFEGVGYRYPARPGPVLDRSTSTCARARPSRSSARAGPARAPSRRCCSGCSPPTRGGSRSGAPTSRRATPARGGGWSRGCRSGPRSSAARSRENIRLGAPGASDEAVRAAAALAGADGFVGALPAGYETAIGDGGRGLGRRAAPDRPRARILREAPLVILDEPTADLDPASVAQVAAAIARLRAGRTVLVIAHRPRARPPRRPRRRARGRAAAETHPRAAA